MYSITCIQRPLKGSNESGLLQPVVFKCRFHKVDLKRVVVSEEWSLKAADILILVVSNTGLIIHSSSEFQTLVRTILSSYRFIGTLPEDSHDIYSTDRGSKVTCDSLYIVEQLAEILYNWDPNNSNTDKYQDAYTGKIT